MKHLKEIFMYSYFDQDHWFKVKAARLAQGIQNKSQVGEDVSEVLTVAGKLFPGSIIKDTDGNAHEVQKITKDWDRGWFYSIQTQSAGRVHCFFVLAVNCGEEWILDEILSFSEKFKVVGFNVGSEIASL